MNSRRACGARANVRDPFRDLSSLVKARGAVVKIHPGLARTERVPQTAHSSRDYKLRHAGTRR